MTTMCDAVPPEQLIPTIADLPGPPVRTASKASWKECPNSMVVPWRFPMSSNDPSWVAGETASGSEPLSRAITASTMLPQLITLPAGLTALAIASREGMYGWAPMMTVMHPMTILLGGPIASMIVSPMRQAGQFSIITVADPSMTTPGPCGGRGHGNAQVCMLAPPAAAATIVALLVAAAGGLAVSADRKSTRLLFRHAK